MADAIHKEMLRTISVLMTTAFAFVAGSAWKYSYSRINRRIHTKRFSYYQFTHLCYHCNNYCSCCNLIHW